MNPRPEITITLPADPARHSELIHEAASLVDRGPVRVVDHNGETAVRFTLQEYDIDDGEDRCELELWRLATLYLVLFTNLAEHHKADPELSSMVQRIADEYAFVLYGAAIYGYGIEAKWNGVHIAHMIDWSKES